MRICIPFTRKYIQINIDIQVVPHWKKVLDDCIHSTIDHPIPSWTPPDDPTIIGKLELAGLPPSLAFVLATVFSSPSWMAFKYMNDYHKTHDKKETIKILKDNYPGVYRKLSDHAFNGLRISVNAYRRIPDWDIPSIMAKGLPY